MVYHLTTINYTTIGIAVIAQVIIGLLWYSKILFGKRWRKALNFTKQEIEIEKNRSRKKHLFASFLISIVTTYILALFIDTTQTTTILGGMYLALLVWLGFIATITLNGVLWERKPLAVYIINAGYYLVALNTIAIILTIF